MSTAVIAPPLPDAPYRGIEPFRFTDQQIFAAREKETWELLSNVTLYRAVLLYGESGTGKSSLVNAGLLPQVLKENYVPDRIRVQPIAGREFKVERIRISTEGDQPTYLPSNFVSSADSGPAASFELSLKKFRARLEEFRPGSNQEPAGGLFAAPRSAPRPLLIFDQFEEFITLFEEAQRVGTSAETDLAISQVPAAQQDILATLVELIQDETLPVKIIFSFREDYLAKLSILFDLCPELLDQSQRLLPPGIDALAEIIRKPFTDAALRAHFLKQKDGMGSELSEDLAKKIAGELGRRSKGDTANLTELQIVCQRLWEANDPEELFADNGIEGLLTGYGADVFRHFTPALRSVAVVLLSHMVTASNTRNIVSEEDLLGRTAECDFNASECGSALAALSRSQIVRREPRHNIYFYEITSEYLVPWIREQVAERKLTEEQRLAAETQARLEAERAEALVKLEAEHRRALIFKYLMAASFLLLVVSLGLGYYAQRQSNSLKVAEAKAVEAEKLTASILKAVQLTSSKNKEEALSGVAQLDELIKENKIPSQLKRVLLGPVLSNPDLEVQRAAFKVAVYAAKDDPELAQSLVYATETKEGLVQELSGGAAVSYQNLTKSLPPRLYIHIGDESQRALAMQAKDALTAKGYVVPGIDNVGSKSPGVNELRFFRKDDPGMPAPKDLVAILNDATREQWKESYTSGYENSANIRPGHFEIWFGAPADSKNGWLRAFPVDDTDNRIRMPFVVTINSASGELIKKLPSGTGYSSLEAGKYTLTANAAGYEQQIIPFSIDARKDTYIKLKFVKKE